MSVSADPTFMAFLTRQAQVRGEATALVCGPQSLTYAALHAAVSNLASGLVHLGLAPRDRVAIFLDATIEAVVSILAAWSAGLVAVPVNPKLKPRQVGHIIADCAPKALVTTARRAGLLAHDCDLEGLSLLLVGSAPADSDGPDLDWKALSERAADAPPHRSIDNDPAAILYTSGSTGLPKGVVVSHRNLICGAQAVNAYLGTRPDDVVLAVLPLSFDAGLSQITTGLMAGAKIVLHGFLRAKPLITLCEAEGVTMITAVPPLWRLIVDGPWTPAASRGVRLFANTGGHMSAPLLAELRACFPAARPFLMYGLTEAFRSTYLDPSEVDRRPDSIGKAIPNSEILVLDERGAPCPPGQVGELVHRGALVTLGYWNRPEETAARFRPLPGGRPGLLAEMAVWSGDLVETDAEGFLYFRGRRDEMIKTSGYRISPLEIESVLSEAPDVLEAAVFGIDDEALGQRPVGAVVLRPGGSPQAVEMFVAARLPGYMAPLLWPLASLPRSPNGKIDRHDLRTRYHDARTTIGVPS
ncbi:acyl-CoA ligase (AMP-forming), exosortase A system-associated [Caulobacter sp. Root487D2Y]|uniref:acyl-CoA ligase (AMP-forming), exosortase A system-associated n=1 Tax=Caulobacter sp. Root487D2Y TaxID=1736547 RepID=UPI000A81629C|nr:acyl-CoA ligase (AMP-forming), exosortase A system-associated [Caulobacter sp. Root487D2Y]